ncbi:MAG: chemotaxis protein CheX [Spirochaetales bacterium]|nr:chemotaxis protein CheX [Spirochaetales bacterium]
MDTKYIEPFIEATINVFREFYKEEPILRSPFLFDKEENLGWDLSAVIGIAGETKGVVSISFPKNLIIQLTEKLVGHEIDSLNDDVIDSTGEIVNIIAGNAKKGLEQYRLVISLPSIVEGPDHKIAWPTSSMPIITIPFDTSLGPFHLSVGLEDIIK